MSVRVCMCQYVSVCVYMCMSFMSVSVYVRMCVCTLLKRTQGMRINGNLQYSMGREWKRNREKTHG